MTREQKLEAALRQIAMKAFRQTDIGENHAAGLSGIRDRHTFLAIRDMANEALAIPTDADTRVVSVDFLETVGEILRIDLSPEYFAIRAIIEGKDHE